MNNDYSHIKNFFKFLWEKENREPSLDIIMKYMPEDLEKINFTKMNSDKIRESLTKYPQLIDKFDLNKLDNFDIINILHAQPQLADKFDLKNKIDSSGITSILQMQPQLVNKLNLKKLKGFDIVDILIYSPQLIDKFDLTMLNDYHIRELVQYQPKLSKYFNDRLLKMNQDFLRRRDRVEERIENDITRIKKNKVLNESTYKVYHGTNEKFSKFDFKRSTQGIIWFTDNIDSIKNHEHGGQGNKYIMTRYITINNPAGWDEYEKYGLQQLEDMGYDGVILPQGDKTDFFIFSPKNISAKDPDKIIFKKVKSFKTEEGNFSIYDTQTDVRNRASMFTVFESPDGWIVRNSIVPEDLRRKGLATNFYKKMNELSKQKTGNPLRSTQPRTLSTGEVVHELSNDGIQLWDIL